MNWCFLFKPSCHVSAYKKHVKLNSRGLVFWIPNSWGLRVQRAQPGRPVGPCHSESCCPAGFPEDTVTTSLPPASPPLLPRSRQHLARSNGQNVTPRWSCSINPAHLPDVNVVSSMEPTTCLCQSLTFWDKAGAPAGNLSNFRANVVFFLIFRHGLL